MHPRRQVLTVAFAIIIAITGFRYWRYEELQITDWMQWDQLFRKQVGTRLDSLMFGVLGAYMQFYFYDLWIRYKKILLVAGIVLFLALKFEVPSLAHINGLFYTVFYFSCISLATLSMLPYLSTLRSGNGLLFKAVTYISLTSYSMYLLNFWLIQHWIIKKINWNGIIQNEALSLGAKFLSYWILVVFLSILLYKYFEVPMTKLRDSKFFKRNMVH